MEVPDGWLQLIKGPQGFRLFLLTRSGLRSLFFCCPSKPHTVHAAQGMEFFRHTKWLVRGHPWSPLSVEWRYAPKGKGKPVTVPRAPKPQESKVARLEAALQALGPLQPSAKSALEMALKMAEDDPDAEPFKVALKQADSRSSAPRGRTSRFVSPVHGPSEEASCSRTGASSPRSPREVGQCAEVSKHLATLPGPSNPHQEMGLRDCEPKWQNSRVAKAVKRKNRFDQRKPVLVGVPQMNKF